MDEETTKGLEQIRKELEETDKGTFDILRRLSPRFANFMEDEDAIGIMRVILMHEAYLINDMRWPHYKLALFSIKLSVRVVGLCVNHLCFRVKSLGRGGFDCLLKGGLNILWRWQKVYFWFVKRRARAYMRSGATDEDLKKMFFGHMLYWSRLHSIFQRAVFRGFEKKCMEEE